MQQNLHLYNMFHTIQIKTFKNLRKIGEALCVCSCVCSCVCHPFLFKRVRGCKLNKFFFDMLYCFKRITPFPRYS